MPVSLSVYSAIQYARASQTPYQRAQSLTKLFATRIQAYLGCGLLAGFSSLEHVDNDDNAMDIRPLSFTDP
jgi:hypothetical protein